MVPPAKALTQKRAICAVTRHTAICIQRFKNWHQRNSNSNNNSNSNGNGNIEGTSYLTVTPQLAYATRSSVCRGLPLE
jgi:hypothetical protein